MNGNIISLQPKILLNIAKNKTVRLRVKNTYSVAILKQNW